jgi:hypothetical protein
MSGLTPAAVKWFTDHHGVITAERLRGCKVGRKATQRLLNDGVLRLVVRGIYVATSVPNSLEQRCYLACAAHPAGFITGPTAGTLGGLRRMPRHSPIHLSVHHRVHLAKVAGVRLRRTTALTQADRVTRDDGITVASWARLAFDLAADLRPLDHLSVLQQLLHEKKVTVDELVAIERRLGHPARPGSGRFRRNLERLDCTAPNESHPEVLLAEALRAIGIPIEHQTRVVRTSTGREAHIDLAVPDIRWGIELDIHPEHRTYEGQAYGAARTRDLHGLDWQIEPVTELDMSNVGVLADELAALFRARCQRLPGVG